MRILIVMLYLSASPAFSAARDAPADPMYIEHLPACYAKSESTKVYQSLRTDGYEWAYRYFEPWTQMNLCFYYYGVVSAGMFRLCSSDWADICGAIPLLMPTGEAYGVIMPQQ